MDQQQQPTMYFLGVSTAGSSSFKMFSEWMQILNVEAAQLQGIDLPLNAPPEQYREVVEQIKHEPRVRGALITSHKINLFHAARDLFDELSADARLCAEISCIYKREHRLIGHVVDPLTAGQAMQQFLGDDYWQTYHADVLCLGAGGAAMALIVHWLTHDLAQNRPRYITLVDSDGAQLDRMRTLLGRLAETDVQIRLVHSADPQVNDRLVSELPPHSLVINATGMGKDLPGSPITDQARFPTYGVVWELNYRGEREFLRHAQAQVQEQQLHVVDGWYYFLVGWAAVIGYVFDVSISEAQFARLAQAAESVRDSNASELS